MMKGASIGVKAKFICDMGFLVGFGIFKSSPKNLFLFEF